MSELQTVYQYIVCNVFNSNFLVLLCLFADMLGVQEDTISIFSVELIYCTCTFVSVSEIHSENSISSNICNSIYKLNEFIHINLRCGDNLSDSQCTMLTILWIEL